MGENKTTADKMTYERVADVLREQIKSGQLAPATVLPSERQFAETYAVTRETIRRAIAQLRTEGLVQVLHGRGAFVRRPGDWPTQTYSRTITVDGDGNYVDSESTVGEWRDIQPPRMYQTNAEAPLALAFGVAQGTVFHASDRDLENQTGTRIFVRSYLPDFVATQFPDLVDGAYVSARQTYAAARNAGMQLDFDDYVAARNPTPDDAHSLRIPDGIPMLITRRIVASEGKPIIMQETHRSGEETQLHYRPSI
ncbi:GntR family transcriptional regulator [Kribbella italica]|uniref:GntR family transcriptional regulator n=1 Tax=Kribbella italica TaxID=1540520 RepID=A0A7W9JFK2_9ACTN|nr:GntR family transcriptional regulator [Kribbella italica]